jgi:hypothetical protein
LWVSGVKNSLEKELCKFKTGLFIFKNMGVISSRMFEENKLEFSNGTDK